MLSISERNLLEQHKKFSGITIGRLLAAIKIIEEQGTNKTASNANEDNLPSLQTQTNCSNPRNAFPYDDDLNTKEGVLNWLKRVVDSPPKSIEVSNVRNEVVCRVTEANVDFVDHWSQFSALCL